MSVGPGSSEAPNYTQKGGSGMHLLCGCELIGKPGRNLGDIIGMGSMSLLPLSWRAVLGYPGLVQSDLFCVSPGP